MAGSYENINYALRPAKSIERKMLVEALRKLSCLDAIESYRYVGFGSPYFSDFALVHKALGIQNMISIERDEHNQDRFKFNRPFNCIHLEFGESTTVLPTLGWDARTILWLDYDGKLNSDMLADIRYVCANLASRSVLIVTVNAQKDRLIGIPVEEFSERRMNALKKRVTAEKVPNDVSGKNLKGWGEAEVNRRIIENEILETLSEKNGGRDPSNEMKYKQLFNFHYADGPNMLTTGGLLYEKEQEDIVNGREFEQLGFVRLSGDDPYLITVPKLTYLELKHLDSQLPVANYKTLDAEWVPEEALESYARVYRYFPTFAETDV